MIIQCEQCTTRFRIDDSKVTAKGVKVRCSKCRHIFVVRQDQVSEEPRLDFSTLMNQAAGQSEQPGASPEVSHASLPESPGAEQEPQTHALPGDIPAFSPPKVSTGLPSASDDSFGGLDDDIFGENPLPSRPAPKFFFEKPAAAVDGDRSQFTETAPLSVSPDAENHFNPAWFSESEVPDLPDQLKDTPAVIPDPPPLSIPSRRQRSPLLTVLLWLTAAAVLGGGGYLGYGAYQERQAVSQKEAGRISLRGVRAEFVTSAGSGELLLISGEAVNEYTAPRASLQVKGMIYSAAGQVLTEKSAYAGTAISAAQLAQLSPDKIEAAMANQFGDSLCNLDVPPGKGIPFSIVMPVTSADAREYGVQAAGSTAATGKH